MEFSLECSLKKNIELISKAFSQNASSKNKEWNFSDISGKATYFHMVCCSICLSQNVFCIYIRFQWDFTPSQAEEKSSVDAMSVL